MAGPNDPGDPDAPAEPDADGPPTTPSPGWPGPDAPDPAQGPPTLPGGPPPPSPDPPVPGAPSPPPGYPAPPGYPPPPSYPAPPPPGYPQQGYPPQGYQPGYPPPGPPGGYGMGGVGPGGPPPPKRGPNLVVIAIVAVVVLLAAVVGGALVLRGGGDDGPSGAGSSTSTTVEGARSGAITTVDEVKSATVQILAQGSFVDPQEGAVFDAAGAGSGFIIDPEGIVVTNNHVVTGAATLRVFVGGDDREVNARILATSECSDLAVIDLEGAGYPFMEFYEGPINPGLDVFAAGFPLGDPEFTLTRGIVSKARASGETSWASVDNVIEHDATINPGNSGGPLVNSQAQVVGVNYAGDDTTSQFFAIAPPTLRDVVASLRNGDPVDYVGINGQVVADDESGPAGVWVAAVEAGSPADDLGLEGGDVITTMQGLSLGTDGTMADYCDVLRTRGTDGEIAVEVFRAPDLFLQGTLNGDDELAPYESFADDLDTGGVIGTGSYSGEYTNVSDDSETLSVDVPVEWAEVSGAPITLDDGSTTPNVVATTSLDGFAENFTTSGVTVALLPGADADDPDGNLTALLEGIGATIACPESLGREDYDDGLYFGRFEQLTGCEETGASFVGIVASPEGAEFTVFVGVQLVEEADYDALDRIIQSFVVTQ